MEESVSPAPAAAASPVPAERSARSWLTYPATALALIAALIAAWQWYDSHRQITDLQQELARRLAAADVQNKESRNVADQVRQATQEAQVKLGMLEAKLQESQNQQIAFSTELVSNATLANRYVARNDARNYIVIGDPAVRLRTELMAS